MPNSWLGQARRQRRTGCGSHGAGRFVKMDYNGIEYGLMAAYAEGLNILRNANVGRRSRDSEMASWRLNLTTAALVEDAELAGFSGRVSDSGEGRWTASTRVCQHRRSARRSSNDFLRAATSTITTGCCPRCASSLAGMMTRKRGVEMDNTRSRAMPRDAVRCASDLRRDRRSRPQDDFSGALRDGQAWYSQRAGGRRRRLEMKPVATAQTGDGQHQSSGELGFCGEKFQVIFRL